MSNLAKCTDAWKLLNISSLVSHHHSSSCFSWNTTYCVWVKPRDGLKIFQTSCAWKHGADKNWLEAEKHWQECNVIKHKALQRAQLRNTKTRIALVGRGRNLLFVSTHGLLLIWCFCFYFLFARTVHIVNFSHSGESHQAWAEEDW